MNRKFYTIVISFIIYASSATSVFAQAPTKVVSLHVNGMTLPTCPVILKSAVRKIKGVKNVEASLETHSATIEFDESITSLENIQDTIELHAGFSTELK